MPAKRAQLVVEPVVGEVADEVVCDYDELDEFVKRELGDVDDTRGSTRTVDSLTGALVDACDCDVVNFTDYYRIRRV